MRPPFGCFSFHFGPASGSVLGCRRQASRARSNETVTNARRGPRNACARGGQKCQSNQRKETRSARCALMYWQINKPFGRDAGGNADKRAHAHHYRRLLVKWNWKWCVRTASAVELACQFISSNGGYLCLSQRATSGFQFLSLRSAAFHFRSRMADGFGRNKFSICVYLETGRLLVVAIRRTNSVE